MYNDGSTRATGPSRVVAARRFNQGRQHSSYRWTEGAVLRHGELNLRIQVEEGRASTVGQETANAIGRDYCGVRLGRCLTRECNHDLLSTRSRLEEESRDENIPITKMMSTSHIILVRSRCIWSPCYIAVCQDDRHEANK